MFILWLLWGIVTFGGLYMGLGSLWFMVDKGFDLALLLNCLIYTGCGLFALPKFIKLFARKS